MLDITHEVPPGDIRRGAAVLAVTCPQLPPAVHLAVVDPGVGTSRRGVAISAGESLLVGPDNGLLVAAAEALGGVGEVVNLSRPPAGTGARPLTEPGSVTFDGRDLFAPAAARLAAGLPLQQAGTPVDPNSLVRLPRPLLRVSPQRCETEIVDVDRFGNCALAASANDLTTIGADPGRRISVGLPGGGTVELVRSSTFADVAAGEPLLFIDSAGRVALAVNSGSAAGRYRLAQGDLVVLTRG